MTLILTGWSGRMFAEMADSTVPLMQRYAKRHGYAFRAASLYAEDTPASWVKIPRIIASLEAGHDTVVWLDVDVAILDSSAAIADDVPPQAWQGLVEHETECGLVPNCGVWVVRRQMLPILHEVWYSRDRHLNHPWWEQAAILERMGYALALQIGWPTATRGQPTTLFDATAFLDSKWNHHLSDRRKCSSPAFVHVTQYDDRVAACKEIASHAT